MIHRYKKLPSTQDLARKLAEDGAPPWTIVLAREQTKGRGRMERRWFSGPGGLYFSIVLRPKIAPESLAKLSPAVGEACARALCRATGLETTVKPPNDVLARARDAFNEAWKGRGDGGGTAGGTSTTGASGDATP